MRRTDPLDVALSAFGGALAAVADDGWGRPTPCPDWTVAQLVEHVVIGNRFFAAAVRGEQPPVPPAGFAPGDGLDGPATPAYDVSARELSDAFGRDGALDRPVTVLLGTVPGEVALHVRVTELLVHAWDLARATGGSVDVPAELVEQELGFTREARSRVSPERTPFAPPRPVDPQAPALDRLAALLGRDPA